MPLVKQKHLNLYKRYTEDLIDDLGINVVAVKGNVTSQCPNCDYDTVNKCSSGIYNGTGPKPFTRGICPVCRGEGELEQESRSNVKCTVNWGNLGRADDFEVMSAGSTETNYFQIKTFVANYNTIKDADYLIIDGVRARLMNIIKRGLKTNVVCVAICKRED
jgi:hypothetical protein